MKNREKLFFSIVVSTSLCLPAFAQNYTKADLGHSLTDFGAIQAGSSDGLVPAYTGGINNMPNLPHGSPSTGWPNPFVSEKPIFVVTKDNMSRYASMLTPGVQAMLERYGDKGFVLDVYPSHRTMTYPSWVLSNTLKNTQTAQLAGNGEGVSGAYGGIPFPVPASGYEAMWDYYLSYYPAYCTYTQQGYVVYPNGGTTFLGTTPDKWAEPYYDPTKTSLSGDIYKYFTAAFYAPASQAGVAYLFEYPINFNSTPDTTYFYSPGTRRTRLAPDFAYDTPIASYGGALNYDEIYFFKGKMDKFNFKLIGRKEMIVPYNDYDMDNNTPKQLDNPYFINPKLMRWETHRVWVVEATLKSDERHVYQKWDFYIDEDSWKILLSESYDHSGNIYKVAIGLPWITYGDGDATAVSPGWANYDLSKDDYSENVVFTQGSGFFHCDTQLPNMLNYTPQSLSRQAVQ